MATLAQTTKETRLILKIAASVIGIGVLGYFLFQGYILFRKLTSPPPPPVQAFGALPHLVFLTPATPGLTYIIDTTNGELPALPDRANVYKLVPPEPSLLDLENSKNNLRQGNFTDNQIKITDTLYQWSQERTGVIIQYDIVSDNFAITSNYLTNPNLATNGLMPDKDRIVEDTLRFLSSIGANTSKLNPKLAVVDYLQLSNGVLVEPENLGSAKYAKVTFYQDNIEDLPIVYDGANTSSINFIVSYPGSLQILEGQFFQNQINLEEKSDYPIKTAQQALEDLKQGKGYMENPQDLTTVSITDAKLQYYLGKNAKDYLLPVIVFTGTDGFHGMVEAIPDSSLQILSQ